MLNPLSILDAFTKNDISFFTGVPDSLLKNLNQAFFSKIPSKNHLIATNEGTAISYGIGYHLATNKIPLIYMQNSGLGNAINPLISLADPEVYSVPMVLLVGWRGEPNSKDEPQHIKQGRITENLLKCLEIPFSILPRDIENAEPVIKTMIGMASKESRPVAILVKKDSFEGYESNPLSKTNTKLLKREEAIHEILELIQDDDIVVGTTGMASREIYEFRKKSHPLANLDFLTVGGMGHASQIALGISNFLQRRNVFCLDGDGALLMHLGGLVINAHHGEGNFHHILLNNGAHDSVGGQPTLGNKVNFKNIAKSIGFKTSLRTSTKSGISTALSKMQDANHPSFLEVMIDKGYRNDLIRPTESPIENKLHFVTQLTKRSAKND